MTERQVIAGFKSMFGKLKEMAAGRKLPKNFLATLTAQNVAVEGRLKKYQRIMSEVGGRAAALMSAEQIDSFQFPKKFSAMALRRKLWTM